jgi:DNA-directed RNA polymerase specialized sigma subunit
LTYLRAKKSEVISLIKYLSKTQIKGEILDLPIDKIDLSTRAINVLLEGGIQKISDFLLIDPKKLYKARKIGITTIYEIKNVIDKLLSSSNGIKQAKKLDKQFPTQTKANDNKSVPYRKIINMGAGLDISTNKISFIDVIENILSILKPKSLYVIKARFGYEDSKRKTLEEIGNMIGLTRERVRQIIVKEIKRLKHPIRRNFLQSFIENIERLLHRYKGIISINDVGKDEYFIFGNRKQLRFLMNLSAELFKERYRIIDRYFLTSLNNNEIKALHFQIREAALKCQFPVDEKVFLKNIISSIGLISEDYLIYHLIYRERIEISKGKVISPGRLSIPQRVKLLLRDINKPMHFTEIAKLYRNHFGDAKIRTSDLERAIHTRVGDSKDFIIVEPGTFILREKFQVPDNIEMIVEISKEILHSLKSVSDTRYLINELKKRNIDAGNLNAYSLKNILLEYPGFVSYRKFEIGLEELADKYERKPLSTLIYGVLLSASKPMHVKNIWKEILKQRGFPEYAVSQRLADAPEFIRVAPATYTVAENIPRYEEKQKIIIDFAKEWITLKKNAISAFFISEVLKETSEIKDLPLGLVEHVLVTSPKFIRLPNGFYDLSNKEIGG